MLKQWLALLVILSITFSVAGFGSVFTASSVKSWYPALLKPPGTPPAWVFAPVWTTLYLLMSLSAWLEWRQRDHQNVWLALAVFAAQLMLNGLWSYIFFGLRLPGAALVEISVLWMAIVGTAILFARHSRYSFWLLTPYLAWVTYAAYLNFGIWRLNRGAG